MADKTPDVEFNMGTVLRVEPRTQKKHVSGAGNDAVMEDEFIGNFVVMSNGLSLNFGKLLPDCQPGESLIVSFRRGQS